MKAVIFFFIVFFTLLLFLTIWCRETKQGRRFISWLFLKPKKNKHKDTNENAFEYETMIYRLYCKNDGDITIYNFTTENEVVRFIEMYKKVYRGKVVRLEKILKAK